MHLLKRSDLYLLLVAIICVVSLFIPCFISISQNAGVYEDDVHAFMSPHTVKTSIIEGSEEEAPPVPALDLEATDCTEILKKFRADKIEVAKSTEIFDYKRSFVTLTKTDKPFYIATHDKDIDQVRASIMENKFYYEQELTKRVAEIFEEKRAQGKESIMIDVGANIGWFSLVAAAHGATKVYSFEPNLQNTVRFCESLSLNHWLREDRSKDIVFPISKGVGKSEEKKNLYMVDENNPGSFTFNKDVARPDKVVGEMEITTLDLFAERHRWFDSKPSIGLFKLDVEHFEEEVLEGARKLLRSSLIEKIAMELKPSTNSEDRESKIVKELFDAGYEFYMHGKWMGPNEKVTKKYDEWQELVADIKNETYGENVMFQLREP